MPQVKYFPFDSVLNNGIDDREYTSADFANYFSKFIGNGVYAGKGNALQIVAINDNMTIIAKDGSGFINGYGYIQNEDIILSVSASDLTYSRIDSVVLRLDLVERVIGVKVIKGIASANPSAPIPVRNSDIYDLVLAHVNVSNSATRIQQSNIADKRPSELCGWVSGTVAQIDAASFFNQYEIAFNQFMRNVSDFLDENTAGNLLNLINGLQTTKADKATTLAGYGITDGATKSKVITATLTVAGWTGSAAPFTQSITATGHVPASKIAQCGLNPTGTAAQKIAQMEAWGKAMVQATDEASNQITFSALKEKPTIDLPVIISIGDKV